ncbi:MAG TPA: hypothetical protein PKZ32_18410 [Candidatus Melainabacteria bacterium]|nr:hypothetical protein [Candidatus Melainabacteria bacterium]
MDEDKHLDDELQEDKDLKNKNFEKQNKKPDDERQLEKGRHENEKQPEKKSSGPFCSDR